MTRQPAGRVGSGSDGSGGNADGDCIDSDDERLYYTQDANFNVTALVDGSHGSVVERYMYSPYGEVEVLDADFSADADGESDYENTLLYCGYYHDCWSFAGFERSADGWRKQGRGKQAGPTGR